MSNAIRRHVFTAQIEQILEKHFGEYAAEMFAQSPLLGYLNEKTKAASRGSKSRGSFANHYAQYVLVEDFHAIYGEAEAELGIEPIALLRGRFPRRAFGMVMEWAAAHQDELLANWELMRNDRPPNRIDPLD